MKRQVCDLENVEQSAGLRVVLRIVGRWGLSDSEIGLLLGGVGALTVKRWRHDEGLVHADLAPDTVERLSLILGIYKDLQILLPNDGQADQWIRIPNSSSLFAGRSALDYMLAGGTDAVWRVRRYLAAQTA